MKFAPEFNRRALDEFIHYELLTGGPDPHMKVATYLAQNVYGKDDPWSQAWFCGLYVAPYNVPTAEVLFQTFPNPRDVINHPEHVATWVKDNWSRLSIRKERRPVNAPHRFAEHLIAYAQWLFDRWPALAEAPDFDTAFAMVEEVRYNGRYATMKLYETLRRTTGLPHHEFADLRPKGGWSPRLMLSWLYPEGAVALNGKDLKTNLAYANDLGAFERAKYGLDWFNMEVMLCDVKQSIDGKQYPGRGMDSELGHLEHVVNAFPEIDFHTIEARATLFPHWALGELNDWNGRRKELGDCLRIHGYTWTDSILSWSQSKDNLASPTRKDQLPLLEPQKLCGLTL